MDPTRVEGTLYTYQLELYHQAKDENAIVFCPTGSGKTMIALAVAEHVLLDRPARPKERLDNKAKHMVLFLSDRISLLEQQHEAFEESKHIRADIVHSERRSQGWERNFKVMNTLFMMASIFLKELELKQVNVSDFDLIILDECHHCYADHAFNKMFTFFFNKAPMDQRPQILGLTASPGAAPTLKGTDDKIQRLCVNMWCKIIMVCKETAELQRRAPIPVTTRKVIELSGSEQEFRLQLEQSMSSMEQFVRELPPDLDEGSAVKRFLNTTSCSFGGTGVQKMEKSSSAYFLVMEGQKTCAASERRYGLARLFHCLLYFSKALVYLSEVGTESAYQYLREGEGHLYNRSSDHWLETNRTLLLKQRETLLCDAEVAQTMAALWNGISHIPLSRTNEKTEYILDTLAQAHVTNPEKFRAIVFVQTKRGAKRLLELVREEMAGATPRSMQLAGLRPEVFFGHGTSIGEDRNTQVKGMNAKMQQKVLKAFRDGDCNVLLATNVAEEGLDIPACNLVVRYDVSFSLTSMIQSRGRARKKGSQFVVVLPASDQEKFNNVVVSEQNMKIVVEGECVDVARVLREQMPWYSLSPQQLLEQYFVDFHREKGEGHVSPHYTNVETMLRSGQKGWYSTLEVPVRDPNNEEQVIFVCGSGEIPVRANEQAAIRACGRLDDMGVLNHLRKENQHPTVREFTQFTSSSIAMTNATTRKEEAIQVFEEMLWNDPLLPYHHLMEWCQRGYALGPPDCRWKDIGGGKMKCIITLRERVSNPEAGADPVQFVDYECPYACDTMDRALHTTALFVLGKKNRWFLKKPVPKSLQRRMLRDGIPPEAMELMAVYRVRQRTKRRADEGFQLSYVPIAPVQLTDAAKANGGR